MAKRHHDGNYEGRTNRVAMERGDGDMMPSGSGQFANMPQSVVHREWPKMRDYMPENLDDSIRGIDRQIDKDESQRDRHLNPKKV